MASIFATNPAEPAAVSLQRNTAVPLPAAPTPAPPRAPARPAAAPTVTIDSTTTPMTYSLNTQQGRDAAALSELTTISANTALDALKANKPGDAAAALRSALGFADRLVTANAAVLTANARQANEFHGYDANNPMAGADPVLSNGSYDLNNL